MRLQQLRYVIAIAESGSINAVAHSMFVSQSSISVSVKELEQEMGITIFNRSSRGISLTSDGVEFLSYARQVVEQADLLADRYQRGKVRAHQRLSVSSQHYAFAVNAFIRFVAQHDGNSGRFTWGDFCRRDRGRAQLQERPRHPLPGDKQRTPPAPTPGGVQPALCPCSRRAPTCSFTRPIRLRQEKSVRTQDLANWPRYTFEQGPDSSLYFSEEPLSSLPNSRQIIVSDRATMTGLLRDYDGFLVSTGVRSDEMFAGIVSIPSRPTKS